MDLWGYTDAADPKAVSSLPGPVKKYHQAKRFLIQAIGLDLRQSRSMSF